MLLCLLLFSLNFNLNSGNLNFQIKEINNLVEIGSKHYKILEMKQKLPQYGLCWKNALKNLNEGCRGLSEKTQQMIAIELTDCFLEMSGHERCNCNSLGVPINVCLKSMSDRAFNAYTEFYTHSHNICFFFQSHFWHEDIEIMVNHLSSSSHLVSKQLEQAELTQSQLLNHQKISLNVQNELLNNALNLNQIMDEYKTATNEQKQILFDVFEKLINLQSWIISEIALVETLFVYFISCTVVYLITATPRTFNSRGPLFAIISFNAFIEYLVNKYLILNYSIEMYNLNRELIIWSCRKITTFICIILICLSILSYKDYNIINYNLLLNIQNQNCKILNYLEQIFKDENVIYKLESELNKNIGKHEQTPVKHTTTNNITSIRNQKKIDFTSNYSLRKQKV